MSNYTFDTTSPHFTQGSFLILKGWDIFSSTFYRDLQLRWEIADTVLTSLLVFLDKQRSMGKLFIEAETGNLKKLAKLWLKKDAGERFWGKHHKYIQDSEDTDLARLEWDGDERVLRESVMSLMAVMQPHARRFFAKRVRFQREQEAQAEKEKEKKEDVEEEEEEEEGGEEEEPGQMATEETALVFRPKPGAQ